MRNRTSTTSWCNVPSCLQDPNFLAVRGRISELLRVPWVNCKRQRIPTRDTHLSLHGSCNEGCSPLRFALWIPPPTAEHLQLLRYEVGQFYRQHHDQISPVDSAWGPRLYTFFMYLSDVEEGGETVFTRLGNVSVSPRKGDAILWPSVLSDDPTETDERTYHEAMPVTKGLKYAANFWTHMYDFQGFHAHACDNRNYLQDQTLLRGGPVR